jgi:opacity protein-like surface antigen
MFRSPPLAGLLRVALACALLGALAAPLGAQGYTPPPLQHAQFGIGYTANLPDVQVGGSTYVLLPRWGGVGVYVDAKFGVSGPPKELGYDASVSAAEIENDLGGTFVKAEGTWWSANAALMRPLSPYFTLYVGGGVAHQSSYRLYNVDRDLNVGVGGVVWARDTRGDEYRPNVMVGMITRLTSRMSAHIGYETAPDGVTVGLSLRLPRW